LPPVFIAIEHDDREQDDPEHDDHEHNKLAILFAAILVILVAAECIGGVLFLAPQRS
jgi:hypothetical protein